MRMDTEQGDRMLQLVKAFRDDPTPDKARELMRLTAQQLVETVDKMPDPLVLRMALNACEGLDPW